MCQYIRLNIISIDIGTKLYNNNKNRIARNQRHFQDLSVYLRRVLFFCLFSPPASLCLQARNCFDHKQPKIVPMIAFQTHITWNLPWFIAKNGFVLHSYGIAVYGLPTQIFGRQNSGNSQRTKSGGRRFGGDKIGLIWGLYLSHNKQIASNSCLMMYVNSWLTIKMHLQ